MGAWRDGSPSGGPQGWLETGGWEPGPLGSGEALQFHAGLSCDLICTKQSRRLPSGKGTAGDFQRVGAPSRWASGMTPEAGS